MAARPILGLVALFLLAGGILLQFLVVLSGGINSFPENLIYFLQASTDDIVPQPRNPSRWTFFAVCGVGDDGHNVNCGDPVPALPFDPTHHTNFNTEDGVPGEFIDTHYYYNLSRFMFAFYIIALFCSCMTLLVSILAPLSRLGALVSGLGGMGALFFQILAASLMTAWTVKGRDAFRAADLDAKVGVYAMAFTWTSVACFALATALFCVAGATGRHREREPRPSGARGRFGGLFRKKSARSTHSRGSFLDSESQRRVIKDEYT
ncbi:SUR7/PalI family-domain-containing protein [Lineolata rhizophorae]|uniref:SUR7/PalI family-domain-containing protein n=1 Tax=Lineolata rhizophorae TaxID=578093 RepID=A0A6A6P9E9_9PEZI|nr:SUR7/PalI family-domain-containing protein [Lineolata rhizophorae]